ncbi:MAG TPA: hypothetical protein VIQ50_13355, partial [Xanthobacteraceae bacterium]
ILDTVCPLLQGSHKHATAYAIENGQLVIQLGSARAALARPQQFVGFLGEPGAPSAILLRNHGLHLEIRIDRPVARDDSAGIVDVTLESAITTLVSVHDRRHHFDHMVVAVYENEEWLILDDLTNLVLRDSEKRDYEPTAILDYRGARCYSLVGATRVILVLHQTIRVVIDYRSPPASAGQGPHSPS